MNKALVVDDSRAIRSILTRILVGSGFEVVQARNGVEALEALKGEAADICLLCADYNMPEMNGVDLIRSMRAMLGFERVPAVMITTETHLQSIQAAFDAGANEYVMKPFTSEMVLEKLRILGVVAG